MIGLLDCFWFNCFWYILFDYFCCLVSLFASAFFFAFGLSACEVVLSFASISLSCFGVVSCWFEMFSCGSSGVVRVNGGAGAAGRFDDAKSVRVGFFKCRKMLLEIGVM